MPGPPVRLKFNEAKAAEAAARLIHLAGGSMNYMKLIKLLYLADRKALEEWARPISSDRYVAMKNGPVLSRVLNLIRSRVVDVPGPWRHLISPPDDYTVSLVTDEPPPGGELSKAEERLIDNMFAEHGSADRFDLVDFVHECPEWSDPKGGAAPIAYGDVLRAVGKSEDEIDRIESELEELDRADRLFA